VLEEAFSNDDTLSKDKSEQQLEGPGDGEDSDSFGNMFGSKPPEQTEVQKKWWATQATQRDVARSSSSSSSRVQAPMTQERLEGSTWELDLFLAGIPSRDPSNDLYGASTNISTRRGKNNMMNVPETPSVEPLRLFLDKEGACRVASPNHPFAEQEPEGQWKLSDDGCFIRTRFHVVGYQRTIQTRGTITNVFWTDSDDRTTATQTVYTIPTGWLYADTAIGYGKQPGVLQMSNDESILRVEKTTGLLGVSSTMVPCGTFIGRPIYKDLQQ
jgi:hypothetical protein